MSPNNKRKWDRVLKSLNSKKPAGLAAAELFQKNGLLKTVRPLDAVAEFYGESVRRSKKSVPEQFTNFLPELDTPRQTKVRIRELFDNPGIILDQVATVHFTERIKACLALYVQDTIDEGFLFKSEVRDALSRQAGVRVYSVLDKPSTPDDKAKYKIVLIDPFHLVIPSEHDHMDKENALKVSWNTNKDNTVCMSTWVDSQSFFKA